MKISKRDRIEALKRNPAYQKDLKKWKESAEQIRAAHLRGQIPGIDLTAETKTFLKMDMETRKRWSILHFDKPLNGGVMFTDEQAAVAVGLTCKDETLYFKKMDEGDDPLEYRIAYEKDEKGISDFKDVHERGRHIYLRIDLTKTDNEIAGDVQRAVTYFKKLLPKKRNKEGLLDHWKVYDMVDIKGLTLTKIAEKDCGAGEDFDDPAYRAAYTRVKRAYNKALQIIEQVNNSQ